MVYLVYFDSDLYHFGSRIYINQRTPFSLRRSLSVASKELVLSQNDVQPITNGPINLLVNSPTDRPIAGLMNMIKITAETTYESVLKPQSIMKQVCIK